MASTIVNIQLPTGLVGATITLYPEDSDTAANTPDTLTEETNRLGLYGATVTEALDGVYYVKVLDGSTLSATGWIYMEDDTETYRVVDEYPVWGDVDTIKSSIATILLNSIAMLGRIGSFTGTGTNTILGFFQSFMRNDGVVGTPTDIGGSYDNTLHSNQAIRTRGDTDWTAPTAAQVATALFTTDTGETYASAVDGSVVKETADNAGGGGLTAEQVWTYSSRTLTSNATIEVLGPVIDSETISIVRGDAYATDDGQQLTFTITGLTCTIASATFSMKNIVENTVVIEDTPGVVVTPSGTIVVTVDLTTAQTSGLEVGDKRHRFDVQGTTDNGNIVTLALGYATVLEDAEVNP